MDLHTNTLWIYTEAHGMARARAHKLPVRCARILHLSSNYILGTHQSLATVAFWTQYAHLQRGRRLHATLRVNNRVASWTELLIPIHPTLLFKNTQIRI